MDDKTAVTCRSIGGQNKEEHFGIPEGIQNGREVEPHPAGVTYFGPVQSLFLLRPVLLRPGPLRPALFLPSLRRQKWEQSM